MLALFLVATSVAIVNPSANDAPGAEAAGNDIIAIVVEGTGNGHGRGMSQWGAYGWAVEQAKTSSWILDHYYGGTVAGTVAAGGRIRVRLLAGDGASSVGLVSHGGDIIWNGTARSGIKSVRLLQYGNTYLVQGATTVSCAGAASITVPDGPIAQGSGDRAAVTQIQQFLKAYHDSKIGVDGEFGSQTRTILTSWQTAQGLPADGVWNGDDAAKARTIVQQATGSVAWTDLGTAGGALKFTNALSENSGSAAESQIGVCQGDGSVIHYRGGIDVSVQAGVTRVVNDVKVEDYLRGVVPKEISASWADAGGGRGAQAVQAQAVAARSYGLQQNRYAPYAQTCDSPACQVYGGAATRANATAARVFVEDFRTDQAIAATANQVRKWPNGAIVSTEFSASNGPRTAGGAFPVRDDAAGDATANNPNHRWVRVIDADTLAAKYGLGSITSAQMVEAAAGQYQVYDGIWFNDIVLTGSNGNTFRQQAWDFRGTFGLPSPGFTVRVVTRNAMPLTMAYIGDSIGVGVAGTATAPLRTVTDGTFTSTSFDSAVNRRTTVATSTVSSGIDVAAALPMNRDVVVVELGYNDPPAGFAADIDAMMNVLTSRGAKRVVWVNMAEIRSGPGGSSYYHQANVALNSARNRWANLDVADWNQGSAGAERVRWFQSDGVHLTTTGNAQFSLWLRDYLAGGSRVSARRFFANQRVELQVVGESVVGADGAVGTVPAGASAVALNITGVEPDEAGYMTVWPCDVARPEASNLNFARGAVVANGVIAPVGASGKVCIYSNQASHLLVDIAGWFAGGTGDAAAFVGTTPNRFIDTRNAIGAPKARIPVDGVLRVPVSGAAVLRTDGSATSIPAGATAVAVNVTAVNPSAAGYLTVWPCATTQPVASNVNFTAGANVANGVVAPIGPDGAICIYTNQQTDILVDVLGWFGGSAGQPPFVGAVPQRLVDTRNAIGGPTGRITPDAPRAVPVRNVALTVNGATQAVPADATAVALNVTIAEAGEAGYATVWPCGTTRPEASNVNFVRGGTVANGVVAPIGPDGSVCVFTSVDAHLIVDIAGWFTGGDPPSFVGNVPRRLLDTRNSIGPAPQ